MVDRHEIQPDSTGADSHSAVGRRPKFNALAQVLPRVAVFRSHEAAPVSRRR